MTRHIWQKKLVEYHAYHNTQDYGNSLRDIEKST